ncbi:hypothetical protein IWW36_003731 [Coemansia brasiliensis]|uniref:Carbohydrate kinase PfkB domain-containing protein n=1 Tax=Coemansia brasiliensis TaxID=2650707 RepID=A0A9W8IB23_9FUNG|nr:hypothetical protein IWW36_003731 [Coemansia brasiliensis]
MLVILGGPTGEQIEAMELEQGIKYQTVKSQLPTRTCTTCLDASTGDMTEMIGVSGLIDSQTESQYIQQGISILQGTTQLVPRALALCGTFPPGLSGHAMAQIISSRIASKTLVFVDAVKDIHPVLAARCIDILKVNSTEVLSILSTVDCEHYGEARSPRHIDLAQAAMKLGTMFDIGIVAVTDGPSTAYLSDTKQNSCWAFQIPDLLAHRDHLVDETTKSKFGHLLLNPLGAGDTCSAVMLNLYLEKPDVVEAFAQGLAAASASCLVPMPNCIFDLSTMQKIRKLITITKL